MYNIYMRKSTKLMNNNKKELTKWRDILCSWIGRLNIVKISILPNCISIFNAITIKMPAGYFMNIEKLILKFTWRGKRPRISNIILKENKFGGLMLTDFKTYYKAIVIKTVWYWQKNRQINQWDRIEILEIDSYIESTDLWQRNKDNLYNKSCRKLDIHLQKHKPRCKPYTLQCLQCGDTGTLVHCW